MSIQADKVKVLLDKIFPNYRIIPEHFIKYKNTKLFFDFYIKELGVLIEVQGKQHLEFVKHFHTERSAFLAQKHRDNLKLEYVVNSKKLTLVYIFYYEKVTKKLLINKINEALTQK